MGLVTLSADNASAGIATTMVYIFVSFSTHSLFATCILLMLDALSGSVFKLSASYFDACCCHSTLLVVYAALCTTAVM